MKTHRPAIGGAAALALFAINLLLVGRLLGIEYLDAMGSIESSHIAIARWARLHWGDLSWFPLWYGGIPYLNTYPPLLHRLVAAVSAIGGASVPHVYHAVTAVFYSLGPVTLYLLAVRLGCSRLAGLAGGVFYSLVSTSTWFIPAVRRDAGGVWGLRRLQDMVQYGEGPHIASMTLLPVAVCLLAAAYERKRPAWWFAAALGLAAVPLTNWLGAAALAMAAVSPLGGQITTASTSESARSARQSAWTPGMEKRSANARARSSRREATDTISHASGHSLRDGTCTISAIRPVPMIPMRIFRAAISHSFLHPRAAFPRLVHTTSVGPAATALARANHPWASASRSLAIVLSNCRRRLVPPPYPAVPFDTPPGLGNAEGKTRTILQCP
jgi:hypothetical protein